MQSLEHLTAVVIRVDLMMIPVRVVGQELLYGDLVIPVHYSFSQRNINGITALFMYMAKSDVIALELLGVPIRHWRNG